MRPTLISAGIAGLVNQSAAYCQNYGEYHGRQVVGTGSLIMWFLSVAIIILVVYYFLRFIVDTTCVPEQSHSLEILKKRYALGEITKDEYIQIKKELE